MNTRLAVNQFMVPATPLDSILEWCGTNQVAGLGVLRACVDELGADEVGARLNRHGVQPTSLCVAMGLIDSDPEIERKLTADAELALADAATLGVPLIVITGGVTSSLRLAEAREHAAERLYRLAETAQSYGTKVLLEPLHPASIHLSAFTSLAGALAVAREHRCLGVVFDTWHLWAEDDVERTLAANAGSIDIVHIADASPEAYASGLREIPGTGLIDLPSLLRSLHSSGFGGWWEIEVLRDNDGIGWRSLLDDSLRATERLFRTASDEVR
ncbi:sugar phosphate isomerase/epimerase family protein [Nocardia nova]